MLGSFYLGYFSRHFSRKNVLKFSSESQRRRHYFKEKYNFLITTYHTKCVYLGYLSDAAMITLAENFILNWGDFTENAGGTLRDLHKDLDFTDVTLVCEDNHQIPCHRVILAASSTLLKAMIKAPNTATLSSKSGASRQGTWSGL